MITRLIRDSRDLLYLGFSWLDVVKFEQRAMEALKIQEDVGNMEQRDVIEGQ